MTWLKECLWVILLFSVNGCCGAGLHPQQLWDWSVATLVKVQPCEPLNIPDSCLVEPHVIFNPLRFCFCTLWKEKGKTIKNHNFVWMPFTMFMNSGTVLNIVCGSCVPAVSTERFCSYTSWLKLSEPWWRWTSLATMSYIFINLLW